MIIWWGEGVGSRIASPVVAVDIRTEYFHAVAAAYAGVVSASPLTGSRLVDTVPLCWVLLRCRGPFHFSFVENVGFWVAEMLPVVGTVPIAGGWAAVSATAVLGLLVLPAIAAWGPMGVHSCSCSGVVPWYDLLASARVVVAASISH